MPGVSVSSYGLKFVPVCLKEYVGQGFFFVILLLAGLNLSFIMAALSKRSAHSMGTKAQLPGGNQEDILFSRLLLTIALLMLLTVCNPFLVRRFVPRFGMTTVYYRVFWVFPLTFGAAYFISSFCVRQKNFIVGLLLFSALTAALVFSGKLNPALGNIISGYALPSNVYKVDGALPGILGIIEEDYHKTAEYAAELEAVKRADLKSEEGAAVFSESLPACIFPYDMEFQVRQYDPGIRLIFERNMRLYYEGNRTTGTNYGGNRYYRQCAMIVQGIYGLDDTITDTMLKKSLKKTGTDYLVAESDRANILLLERAGCTKIAEHAGYDVWRFGLDDIN